LAKNNVLPLHTYTGREGSFDPPDEPESAANRSGDEKDKGVQVPVLENDESAVGARTRHSGTRDNADPVSAATKREEQPHEKLNRSDAGSSASAHAGIDPDAVVARQDNGGPAAPKGDVITPPHDRSER
jgi:hypothetical protein